MTRLRIVSDGARHRVETLSGELVTNVKSVTIDKLEIGELATATLELAYVPLELVVEIKPCAHERQVWKLTAAGHARARCIDCGRVVPHG